MIKIICLFFCLWLPTFSNAQALANLAVNRAIGSTITNNAIRRGFAANDPRIAATLDAASNHLNTLSNVTQIAGVGLSLGGSPLWITLVAALGAFSLAKSFITDDAVLSLEQNQMILKPTGVSRLQKYPQGLNVSSSAWNFYYLQQNSEVKMYRDFDCVRSCVFDFAPSDFSPDRDAMFSQNIVGFTIYFNSLSALQNYHDAVQKVSYMGGFIPDWIDSYGQPPYNDTYTLKFEINPSSGLTELIIYYYQEIWGLGDSGWEKESSRSGKYNGTKQHGYIPNPTYSPIVVTNLGTQTSIFDSPFLKGKVEPFVISDITTEILRKIQNEPGVLPNDIYSPIVVPPSDVTRIVTIGDFFTYPSDNNNTSISLLPSADGSTKPDENTNPTPGLTTDVRVINTPNVNIINWPDWLGSNPNVSPPVLPDYPIASKIFEPFLQLVKPLINFTQVSIPAGNCPKPEFLLFGKTIIMTQHCDIFEQNRQTIQSIMSIVFAIAALLIVFSA